MLFIIVPCTTVGACATGWPLLLYGIKNPVYVRDDLAPLDIKEKKEYVTRVIHLYSIQVSNYDYTNYYTNYDYTTANGVRKTKTVHVCINVTFFVLSM